MLKPNIAYRKLLSEGLELGIDDSVKVAQEVYTWGYPLGFNGPSPLFSSGYISGVKLKEIDSANSVQHFVINGSINKGNSGGPLFIKGSNKVIGIACSTHVPGLTSTHQSALKAMHNSDFGKGYTATDEFGNISTVFESQIIAEFLEYYRESY